MFDLGITYIVANVNSAREVDSRLTAAMVHRMAVRGALMIGSVEQCSHVQSRLNRAKNQDLQDGAHCNLPTRHSSELLDNWPRWVGSVMKQDAIKKPLVT